MASTPSYINWLTDTGQRINTACGKEIEVWELTHQDNEAVLSEWAWHFRQNYINDAELPAMVDGTGLTNSDYLLSTLFPDQVNPPGPSVRAGDFGEILIADFMEFLHGYWSPRELRYQDRWNRNDSTKGCDFIGFKFVDEQIDHEDDEIFIYESKSGMTVTVANRLQDAIDDSIKDKLRESMTLNALKQRLLVRGSNADVDRIKRFQNETSRPFRRVNGAAAILDNNVYLNTDFTACNASTHPNVNNLRLIVIKGPSLMTLVHALYSRAANEA